jgi:hypothetical protein
MLFANPFRGEPSGSDSIDFGASPIILRFSISATLPGHGAPVQWLLDSSLKSVIPQDPGFIGCSAIIFRRHPGAGFRNRFGRQSCSPVIDMEPWNIHVLHRSMPSPPDRRL